MGGVGWGTANLGTEVHDGQEKGLFSAAAVHCVRWAGALLFAALPTPPSSSRCRASQQALASVL